MMKLSRCSGYLILLAGLLLFAAACKKAPVEPDPPVLVATPVFSPAGGNLLSGQAITITCPDTLATIRYTLDGGDPNIQSPVYTGPLVLSGLMADYIKNGVLKAKAFKYQADPSLTVSASFTIDLPALPSSFATVQGGTFHNGTANVSVSGFYMDKYEVRQDHYTALMSANPSYFPGLDTHPVEQVSWFNAIEYCNRMSIQQGLTPCYSYSVSGVDPTKVNPDEWPPNWFVNDGNHAYIYCNWAATGFRLPTEMEWMFAARGGTLSQGRTYSGSNTLNDVGWYYDNWGNSNFSTCAVGLKQPNELGIYDLSGNIYEMVWDVWGDYYTYNTSNPRGSILATLSGESHTIRGGNWQGPAAECTPLWRNESGSTSVNKFKGFRVMRIIP